MYTAFLAEYWNRHYHETAHGFFTYELSPNQVHMWDVYIKPKSRRLGKTQELPFEAGLII